MRKTYMKFRLWIAPSNIELHAFHETVAMNDIFRPNARMGHISKKFMYSMLFERFKLTAIHLLWWQDISL